MAHPVAEPLAQSLEHAVLATCRHCMRTIYAFEADMPFKWLHLPDHKQACRPPLVEDEGEDVR